MFEREYRGLSDVPRWTIIRTIQKQNVAEHSFYVALYASQIARLIGFNGSHKLLLNRALRHDVEEMFMSDIPGPSKRAIVHDRDKYDEYCFNQCVKRFGEDYDENENPDKMGGLDRENTSAIIKVADLMDECFFLAIDQQLGNRAIQIVFEHSLMRLQDAVSKLPCDKVKQQLVYDAANKAIYAHRNDQSIIPIG